MSVKPGRRRSLSTSGRPGTVGRSVPQMRSCNDSSVRPDSSRDGPMQAEWPRLDRVPVALPPLGGALSALWATLLDLAERLTDVPWTVIGGQMVLLHALEHGTMPPRFSTDIDAAVDVRTAPKGVSRIVAELQALD